MTCIVGLSEGGTVYIGGDSAGVGGLDLKIRRDRKVFVSGPFVIGCTSSFRMIQLLQYGFTLPVPKYEEGLMEFMATRFIEAVRERFKAGGYAKKENEVEAAGNFLVGVQGRLFQVHSDYQVAEATDPFDACGCGEGYAIGVMYATTGESPVERITKALRAAETYSAGVRGPFHIEKVSA